MAEWYVNDNDGYRAFNRIEWSYLELIALDTLHTKLPVQVHVSVTVISIDSISNDNIRTDVSPKRTYAKVTPLIYPNHPSYPNKSTS